MKSYYKKACILFAFVAVVYACTRKPTDFRSFLDGKEVIYPGTIGKVAVLPGNYRLMITWHPNPDPSVTKYVVYWNNYADSTIVAATSHNPSDTVKCLIGNLQEYSYTFFIYSFDDAGNKSISTEIDNARVYGDIYKDNLLNRPINRDTPYVFNSDNSLTLMFQQADSTNVTTVIKYTNTSGTASEKMLSPNSSSYTLTDYKLGTSVLYQSSYIPRQGAIDTFTTSASDTVPAIFKYVECNKGLFKALNLPHDIHDNYYGTSFSSIWDGSTSIKGYPQAFCSDGIEPLANHFSIDLGATYTNLARIQEIGRNCCSNPLDFEVWGIADTTHAVSQLEGNDPNWKSDILAKGWTLLTEVVRADDGSAPVTANFIDNPPPVRYIMIRVLTTANGNSSGTNLSQVTFYNKE